MINYAKIETVIRMIKMIATDLDGTLLHPKRVFRLVSRPNRTLLREFFLSGGKLALVSGRSYEFCQKIAKRLGVPCDIIACAGAVMVRDDGGWRQDSAIPLELAHELDRFFESKRAPAIRLYTLKDQPIIATGWVLRAWEKFLLPLYILKSARYQEKTVYRKKPFTELFTAPEAVLKMSLVFYEKNLDYIRPIYRELKDRYGKRLEFSLFKNGLEITAKGIDKGRALMQLAAQHGIAMDEVAVIGDDANDIPMFKLFPQSFAMGHGMNAAKTAAKYELQQFSDLKKYLG